MKSLLRSDSIPRRVYPSNQAARTSWAGRQPEVLVLRYWSHLSEAPTPKVIWLRRPAAYAVAAAACAALIVAPFVLAAGNDEQRVDVDGDNTPDDVRIRAEQGDPIYGRLRVEADLSSTGSQVFGTIDSGGIGFGVPEGIQEDADAGRELVLLRTTNGGCV